MLINVYLLIIDADNPLRLINLGKVSICEAKNQAVSIWENRATVDIYRIDVYDTGHIYSCKISKKDNQ